MFRKPFIAGALLVTMLLLYGLPRSVSAQDVTSTAEPSTTEPVILAETTVSTPPAVEGISFPESGVLLRGVVDIRGTAFSAWDLSFSYRDNPMSTWFLLSQSSETISNGLFATWDTNSIVDGMYVLRLRIMAADGTQEKKVNVRVANQLPQKTETSTPTPAATIPEWTETATVTPTQLLVSEVEIIPTSLVTPTVLPTSFATPTILSTLPDNPAVLNPKDIMINLGKGILSVVILFGLAGFVLFLRRR
jgi:hypothetical protein